MYTLKSSKCLETLKCTKLIVVFMVGGNIFVAIFDGVNSDLCFIPYACSKHKMCKVDT